MHYTPPPTARAPLPLIVALLAVLTLLSIVVIILSGLGTRWGWWHYRTGFRLLSGAVTATMVFMVLTLIAGALTSRLSRGRSMIVAGVTLAVGAAAVWMPISMALAARRLPLIHDITTDPANPPPFVDVLPRRAQATNPVEYGGDSVAALQRAAYPDVQPITLTLPPAQALERAESVAREMGWEIVGKDAASGRLEATDRTTFFGFYDDIVVRVEPQGSGSRVDVRSLSRVGLSDVGMNAKRIRQFSRRLRS
jgi:uncharacterized protein (DUF1499 family)